MGTSRKEKFLSLDGEVVQLNVNLLDHCAFCLCQLYSGNKGTAPKFQGASSNCSLFNPGSSFQSLWRTLIPRCRQMRAVKFLKYSNSGRLDRQLEEIPPLCDSCGRLVAELGQMMDELVKKTEQLRRITKQSSKLGSQSERFKRFQRALDNSDVEESIVESTLEFLELLRTCSVDDESGIVLYRRTGAESHPEKTEDDDCRINWGNDAEEKGKRARKVEIGDIFSDDGDHDDHFSNEEDEDSRPLGCTTKEDSYTSSGDLHILGARLRTEAPKKKTMKAKQEPKKITSSKTQRCDMCHQIFPLSDMIEHMKGHVGDYLTPCPNPICGNVFSCPAILEKKHFTDSVCGAFAKKLEGQVGFIKTCETCGFETSSFEQFRAHLQVQHETEMKPFQCPVANCKERFTVRESVQDHITSHTRLIVRGPGNRNVMDSSNQQCFTCLNRFSPEEMEKHLKNEHSAAGIFRCEHCPHLFLNHEHLQRHLRIHPLQGNLHEVHSTEPLNPKISLNHKTQHKLAVHGRFRCNIEGCNKTFASYQGLKIHKRSIEHLGKTNAFVCDLCGKGFNVEISLKRHLKVKHSNAAKPICEECGESFACRDTLKRHQLTHTGERPYECSICHQRFRQLNVRNTHMKSHVRKGDSFKPSGPMNHIRKRKSQLK